MSAKTKKKAAFYREIKQFWRRALADLEHETRHNLYLRGERPFITESSPPFCAYLHFFFFIDAYIF